jgi:hypothetical protein
VGNDEVEYEKSREKPDRANRQSVKKDKANNQTKE